MGLLFGSHQNLGLVKPVGMTTVIKTIRKGNIGSRMEISITLMGWKSLQKRSRGIDFIEKEDKERVASEFQDS